MGKLHQIARYIEKLATIGPITELFGLNGLERKYGEFVIPAARTSAVKIWIILHTVLLLTFIGDFSSNKSQQNGFGM